MQGGGNMEKATLSVEETAKYLGIGRNKAYELVGSGIIPHIKLGNRLRVPRKILESWISEQIIKKAQ